MWSILSDKRVKKDIHNFSDGLNIIKQMNTVAYKYNGKAGNPDNGKEYVGIIAQEVQEYAPYMIEARSVKLDENDSEETELLQYNGSTLTYVLVNAVKEQQEVIEAQQAEIETMKAKNQALQTKVSEVDELKAENQKIKADNEKQQAEIENIKAMLGMNNEIAKNK